MVNVTDYFKEEEKFEEVEGVFENTGYPKPSSRYKVLLEKVNNSLEGSYYWVVDFIRHAPIDAYSNIIKITDIFSASEQSTFFASAQGRLGIQQDKVSQFLGTIGKMVKELFQLVREIRVIDERLDLYIHSYQGDQASDIALKGYWIDLVEGGAKNPASVYGMARELSFATLPDLFFGAPAGLAGKEIQRYVEALDFNKKVKEVLMRKLKTYITWKEHTYKELSTRRRFTIKFLRQHWSVIHMYTTWAKPYLKNIKRLQMRQKRSIETDPDIISSFEGSIVELEILATKKKTFGDDEYVPCVLINFWFRTTPKMEYHGQEYHHKAAAHIGKLRIDIRSYAWTGQDIKNYQKMREEESMDILKEVDSSVKAAMDALGDDLRNYLIEAGEDDLLPEERKKKTIGKKQASNPFTGVIMGFAELFGALIPSGDPTQKKSGLSKHKKDLFKSGIKRKKAESSAKGLAWNLYKNFKKANGIAAW